MKSSHFTQYADSLDQLTTAQIYGKGNTMQPQSQARRPAPAPAPAARPAPRDYSNRITTGSQRPVRIAIAGVEGVGKTTAAAEMPSPLIICGEDGLIGPLQNTPAFHPADWADLLGFVDSLVASDNLPFQSLAIDTLDWLEPLIFSAVVRRAEADVSSIEDFGYGKGYVMAAEEFRKLLAKLELLQRRRGLIILFLAHSEVKTYNNPLGDNYDRYQPKLCKQISALAREWVDELWFATFEVNVRKATKKAFKGKAMGTGRRIIYTSHGPGWDAKSRHGLPAVMALDMPEIMQKLGVSNGAGGDVADIRAEIDELRQLMPAEMQPEIDKALEGAPPAKLARIRNRLLQRAEEMGEQDGAEPGEENDAA